MTRRSSDDASWQLIAELFRRHVPEVSAGIVEVRAVARIAGVRTKVAVESRDPSIDCVRACVGDGGRRVAAIVAELGRAEKLDLIPWADAPERLIRLALAPAVTEEVVLDVRTQTATVAVRPESLFIAVGPDGINRQLAERISGWQVEVVIAEDAA